MPYNIVKSDGTVLVELADNVIDTTTTSLGLIGRGTVGFGTVLNDNFLHVMENFNSATAPHSPLQGQLWYNKLDGLLRVYDGANWGLTTGNPGTGSVTVAGIPVTIGTANGVIVTITSDTVIPNASLPVTVAISAVTYILQARFPNGIGIGITVSSDAELSGTDSSDTLTTTKWVKALAYAPILSPSFAGTPQVPTPATGDATATIPNTAWVKAAFAPIISPIFTGVPKSPTPAPGDNSTSISTTAFVAASFAPILSPTFTGTPHAPTPATTSADTSIATTAFVAAFVGRTRLTANLSLFVTPTGNDSTGTGTSAKPWATLQAAWNYILNNVDTNGHTVTVNVADGTYAPLVASGTLTSSGIVSFVGDVTTPANCTISATSAHAITATNYAQISVSGFRLVATGTIPTGGGGLCASLGGQITIIGSMTFAACSGAHIYCFGQGIVISTGVSYSISAAAPFHIECSQGFVNFSTMTVTISAAITVTVFITANFLGFAQVTGSTFSGSAVTGAKYLVTQNSMINTNGGGVSYFPGSVAGSFLTGGVYV